MLMEMNVFQALGDVLGLYSNIAIAWMMAVVADLVVNKPLGLSPPGIEFKRAHLYDINPVGVGAMALASVLSIAAHLGVFGPTGAGLLGGDRAGHGLRRRAADRLGARKGRYYIARAGEGCRPAGAYLATALQALRDLRARVRRRRTWRTARPTRAPICSLCCTLDARCGDLCKPQASLSAQWSGALRWLLPRRVWPYLDTGLGHFLLLMLIVVPLLAAVFGLLYHQELRALAQLLDAAALSDGALRSGFLKAYMALLVIAGIVAWWLVLAHKSRQVAQEESNRQTHLLMREIELAPPDRRSAAAGQAAGRAGAARGGAGQPGQEPLHQRHQPRAAHAAQQHPRLCAADGRGRGDAAAPQAGRQRDQARRRAPAVADRRHAGHRAHRRRQAHARTSSRCASPTACTRWRGMFELQAAGKGLAFRFEAEGALPEVVRADEKRLRQILINLLGNADQVHARRARSLFRVRYAREMALFEIEDTGPGMTRRGAGADLRALRARRTAASHAAPRRRAWASPSPRC